MSAMCKLWGIRKYSSQSFQPRIKIYMYRRLAFIAAFVAHGVALGVVLGVLLVGMRARGRQHAACLLPTMQTG